MDSLVQKAHSLRRWAMDPAQTGLADLLDLPSGDAQDGAAGKLLVNIALNQRRLGLPDDSPAVMIDVAKGLAVVSAAAPVYFQNDAYLSVIECMQIAAGKLDVFDFAGTDASLYCLGRGKNVQGKGAIYNFAPGRIVVFKTPPGIRLPVLNSEVGDYYWKEAKIKRGIEAFFVDTPLCAARIGKLQAPVERIGLTGAVSVKVPDFLIEFEERWEGTLFNPEGALEGNEEVFKDLMEALHLLALKNVKSGGGPFAASVISPEGRLTAAGVNRVVSENSATAHGEERALMRALLKVKEKRPAESNLSGFVLVTTSCPCLACAEQAALYKLKGIVYDNPKDTVESAGGFTEGPLKPSFFSEQGIALFQVRCSESIGLAPFVLYSQIGSKYQVALLSER